VETAKHTLSGGVRFTSNTQRHTRIFISVLSRRLIRRNSRRQPEDSTKPHTQAAQPLANAGKSPMHLPESQPRLSDQMSDHIIQPLCCRTPIILGPGSLLFRRWILEKSRKIGIQRRALHRVLCPCSNYITHSYRSPLRSRDADLRTREFVAS
jgi:hypothetical protein